MHSQVLVIYPEDVQLDDVMYWYQEIDKPVDGRMDDERCQFNLTIPEKEIPDILREIYEYSVKTRDKDFEVLQQRTQQSYNAWKEKYGAYTMNCLESYTYWCDKVEVCEKIMKLPIDDPEQIGFIKDSVGFATDKWADIYIKGKGYGEFDNPYNMWDFYTIIDEHRFPRGTKFLVDKNGVKDNQMTLNRLDVDKTVKNINELTYVWEHIIFCEKTPDDSRLYTLDDIRFKKEWNKDCLITDLEEKLQELTVKYNNGNYLITAIDTHW